MKTLNIIKLENEHISTLNTSLNVLNVNNIQTYFPALALYFDFYNNDSYTKFTIRNKHIVYKLKNELDNKYDDSYIKNIYNADILNTNDKSINNTDIFVKINPIYDVINYLKNGYRVENPLLSNIFNYTTNCKINSYNNTAYIDALFTHIGNYYYEKNLCPTFPRFYGTFSCVKDGFKFDVTEEYEDMKEMPWFKKNLNNLFTLEEKENTLYKNRKEELNNIEFVENTVECNNNSDHDVDSLSISSGSWQTDVSSCSSNVSLELDSLNSNISFESEYKYLQYCVFNNLPVQMICLEKLEGTLDNYLDDNYNFSETEWKSILFQISFGLAVGQKHHNFVHNDLHSSNIMFKNTEEEYLYFRYKNKYFKIPTFNKITKIIDFGRATFNIGDRIFFSDVFKKNGDAEGQYSYPYYNNLKNCKIKPNNSFDLCRLGTTIASHHKPNTDIYKLIKLWCSDKYGNNLLHLDDDFDLYKIIAKNVRSAIPTKQIEKVIFREFLVKKEEIPESAIIYTY